MNVLVCVSGAAESGKSTLLKQIKIIYSHGFSKPELVSFKVLTSAHNSTFHAVETIKDQIELNALLSLSTLSPMLTVKKSDG